MIHRSRLSLEMLVGVLAILCFSNSHFALALRPRAGTSTTNSAPTATHTINAGADGLQYTPNTVNAAVGDVVLFRFYPLNHSVARADYMNPCIPYELTGAGRVGFWSGFQPVNVVLSDPPTFSVIVNDTEPIFFYCVWFSEREILTSLGSAPGACINNGMVGVINPNATETFAIQQAYALNSTLELSPGESFPSEGTPTPATPSPTATSTSRSSTATDNSNNNNDYTPPLSGGAIAGIAIGGFAVLLLGGALVYFCGRQRTVTEILQTSAIHGPSSYGAGPMSMGSSAGYGSRYPPFGVDPMGLRDYSSQVGIYDHPAGIEAQSYRSTSPPPDESGVPVTPHQAQTKLAGSPVPISPPRLDIPRSPGRPIRPSQSDPASPIEDSMYQPLAADIPRALKLNRLPSQTGPHELSSGNDEVDIPALPPQDLISGSHGSTSDPS